jgi:DNA repair protein SbcD/Mre11
VDSVALCEDALARLRGTGARVILISGNHDSALRLGVNSALIDTAGVHLRTNRARLAEPVVLTDEHGPVAVYGVPYLEPALGLPDETAAAGRAAEPGAGEEPTRQRSHATVLGQAAARIRADAAARGMNRTVVMAHAWVAAGGTDDERRDAAARQQSSSERDISVGGIGYVPAALFDGFSYVALGHLHGQQTLAEHLRYSGSPLPYSFSEKNHKKGSWLVEVGIDGKTRVERVAAPVYRRLAELAGRIDDLLTSAEYEGHDDDFVAVTLIDAARPEAAMDRLRRRFPHILTLEFKPDGVTRDQRSYRERVKGRDDLTVAAEFVRHVRNTEATRLEQELLAQAFTAARDTANDAGERGR